MNCREARKWMSPYLDSELGQTKTFEVSEHLRNCPECTARFEAERNVDEMIRDRIGASGAQMPEQLWGRVGRNVATPAWVRRLRETRTHMALAACLVLAVVGAALFWLPQEKATAPWIVGALASVAPESGPFPLTEAGAAEAEALLGKAFGLRITLDPDDPDANHHFGFHLASAERKTDDRGRGFLELRLNCCGRPVLMVVADEAERALPVPFDVLPAGDERYSSTTGGVHIAAARRAGFSVVIASRHSVSHILSGLNRIDA